MNFVSKIKRMKPLLEETDQLSWKKRDWLVSPYNSALGGYELTRDDNPKIHDFIDYDTLFDALNEGTAKIRRGHYDRVPAMIRRLYGDKPFRDYKAAFKALANHKFGLVQAYECHCREHGIPTRVELRRLLERWNSELNDARRKAAQTSKKSNKQVDAAAFNPPTDRTFLAYFNMFLEAGRDIRIFLPRHKGPGKHHRLYVDPESYVWWRRGANEYLDKNRPTRVMVHRECVNAIDAENEKRKAENADREKRNQARGEHERDEPMVKLLVSPSLKQISTIIARYDKYEVLKAREGILKAMAVYRQQETGFDVSRPGEHVDFDFWLLECQTFLTEADLWANLSKETKEKLRPQRIYLSMARDAYTGYILAIKASLSENSAVVIDTLDMAIADKHHIATYVGATSPWYGGVRIQSAYADNGSAFIADETHNAFRGAGVSLSHPPAGQPWHRAFIESMFATIARTMLGLFHGRTFSNMVEKGDYKSEEEATLTAEEMVSLIIRLVLDSYHQKTNWRTGKSPQEAWEEYIQAFPVQWGADLDMRITVFGVEDTRVNHPYGVTVWGIRYCNEELARLRKSNGGKDITIRYHKEDLRFISVLGPDGWFLVKNRIRFDDQFTLREWIEARREQRCASDAAASNALPTMTRALSHVMSSVDAARDRANLAPSTTVGEDLKQLERELFGEMSLEAEHEQEVALPRVAVPSDPLREGGVKMKRPVGLRRSAPKTPTHNDMELDNFNGENGFSTAPKTDD